MTLCLKLMQQRDELIEKNSTPGTTEVGFTPETLAEIQELYRRLEALKSEMGRVPAQEQIMAPVRRIGPVERVGRNNPCPCGSGKKYKHCCIRK